MGQDRSTTGHDSTSLAATPSIITGGRIGKGSGKKRHGLPLNGKKYKTPKSKIDDGTESNRTLNSSRNSIFESNNQPENKTTSSNGILVPAFKRNNLFNSPNSPDKKGQRANS